MTDVVREYANEDRSIVGYSFRCPGCEQMHTVRTVTTEGPLWGFNGNRERPTFTPSIHVNPPHLVPNPPPGDPPVVRCHSFVNDGSIQFLGDCTHKLAGQVHALKPIPEGW